MIASSDADRRAASEVMVSGGLGESLPGARASWHR